MSAHKLTPKQVASIAAERAPEIALSVVLANEHAAMAPFASVVEAIEHDLFSSLENLRIEEGGEADV